MAQHNCHFPGQRVNGVWTPPRPVGLIMGCGACKRTWRWDGMGWLRINKDGSTWCEVPGTNAVAD